jgi:hypothetical protein
VAVPQLSIRKLADYLSVHAARPIEIRRERLRQMLQQHNITFQRTKTWKESTYPQRHAKLARAVSLTDSSRPMCVPVGPR